VLEAGTARVGGDADGSPEPVITGVERLIFFSDAVVAIAITLLALDLHVPDQVTNAGFWRELSRNHSDYLGFLISFAVIGNHWLSHHRIWGNVTRLTGRLLQWNLLWLLMIVLTPFATRVIVANGAFAARFTLYALVQALASGLFMVEVREMDRHDLVRAGTPRSVFSDTYLRTSFVTGAFLVSIPVAYVTHWAYACWAAVPAALRLHSLWRNRSRRAESITP
jgi:uncharacterized membrane protein